MAKSHSIQHVSKLAEYHELIAGDACVVKFTAEWCGPCKRIAPIYEKFANDHGNLIKFLQVDIDSAPEITHEESIQSVPMFMFYYYGAKNKDLEVRGASSTALIENMKLFESIVDTYEKAKLETQQGGVILTPETSVNLADLALDDPQFSDSEPEIDDNDPEIGNGSDPAIESEPELDPDSDPDYEPDSEPDEPFIEKTIPESEL